MAWTNIPNANLAAGAPIRSVDILALRDNITALANDDAGAPAIKYSALENFGVYGAIGSYVIAGITDGLALSEKLPNVTVAGSSLSRSNNTASNFAASINLQPNTTAIVTATSQSLGLTGTWRRMTRSRSNDTGANVGVDLYVRIS
jgi:hypothetical protein